MLNEKSATYLVHSLCCEGEYDKEECLERNCTNCSDMIITPIEFNSDDQTHYKEWKSIKIPVIIKGTPKICQKLLKEKVYCNKGELLSKMKKTSLRQSLKSKKLLGKTKFYYILISLKTSTASIQNKSNQLILGGSKPLITLHTSVCYYSSGNLNKPSHKSFCTLSESHRHDPTAITAHLDCALDKIKETLVPGLKKSTLLVTDPVHSTKIKLCFICLPTISTIQ